MALHLLKMAVGVDDISHLARLQASRLERARAEGEPAELRHFTRNTPRRARDIVDGGSIYWIIRGGVRARQRILRIDRGVNADGRPRCVLVLDPSLVAVAGTPQRPLRGWRYLEAAEAPPDRAWRLQGEAEMPPELPPEMESELRRLGLL